MDLFGRTVDNFGERPSNWIILPPDRGGRMVRQETCSPFYRRDTSSAHDPANAKIDPNAAENEPTQAGCGEYARRHARGIRSSGFKAVEGSPVEKMDGNIGRNPKQLEELRKAELDPSICGFREVLKTFDFAEPDDHVPTQALFLLNSDFVIDKKGLRK